MRSLRRGKPAIFRRQTEAGTISIVLAAESTARAQPPDQRDFRRRRDRQPINSGLCGVEVFQRCRSSGCAACPGFAFLPGRYAAAARGKRTSGQCNRSVHASRLWHANILFCRGHRLFRVHQYPSLRSDQAHPLRPARGHDRPRGGCPGRDLRRAAGLPHYLWHGKNRGLWPLRPARRNHTAWEFALHEYFLLGKQ